MYDTVYVYMQCPFCKNFTTISCQTKDLDNSLWEFYALPEDWFKEGGFFGREFYKKSSVLKSYPYDKSHTAWNNIAEKKECMARVPEEFWDLEFVNVICDCDLCNRGSYANRMDYNFFRGKIRIQNGLLIGEVYDIEE